MLEAGRDQFASNWGIEQLMLAEGFKEEGLSISRIFECGKSEMGGAAKRNRGDLV